MATQFQHDCPHCLSEAVGFTCAHQWADRRIRFRSRVLAICGVCNHGIVINVYNRSQQQVPNLPGSNVEFPTDSLRILEVSPEKRMDVPADVPVNIERFFTQGLVNLRGENWDAAGAMFRKTLDVATKLIAPDGKSKSLFARIEALVGEGLLTPAMGEWSHEIRMDGNDAVHDEEPETPEDAAAIQQFTGAFLKYAFSLPSMVAQNRAKRDSADQDTATT